MSGTSGDVIGRMAVSTLWDLYGDELRALPSGEQRQLVLEAMNLEVPQACAEAFEAVDPKDRSRINALVTQTATALAAFAIARAGVRRLREIQADNAAAVTAAALGKAAA